MSFGHDKTSRHFWVIHKTTFWYHPIYHIGIILEITIGTITNYKTEVCAPPPRKPFLLRRVQHIAVPGSQSTVFKKGVVLCFVTTGGSLLSGALMFSPSQKQSTETPPVETVPERNGRHQIETQSTQSITARRNTMNDTRLLCHEQRSKKPIPSRQPPQCFETSTSNPNGARFVCVILKPLPGNESVSTEAISHGMKRQGSFWQYRLLESSNGRGDCKNAREVVCMATTLAL